MLSSICGYSYRDSSVPATGSIELTYTVNKDGKGCTVTGIGNCPDDNVVIPKINPAGYPVTAIGYGAFQKYTSLISITIPGSVTSIGGFAFFACTNLTSINFLDTIVQWNTVKKEDSWCRDMGNFTIHCTDGNISK